MNYNHGSCTFARPLYILPLLALGIILALIIVCDGCLAFSTSFEMGLRCTTPTEPLLTSGMTGTFSPDDCFIATPGLQVYESTTGKKIPLGPVSGLPFWSPDGNSLVMVADYFAFWNTSTWQFDRMVNFTWRGYSKYMTLREDSFIYVNTANVAVIVNLTDWSWTSHKISDSSTGICALSPDGTRMAISSSTELEVVSFPDGALVASFDFKNGWNLVWSSDGRVVFCMNPTEMGWWDLTSGDSAHRYHNITVSCVDPIRKIVYVGHDDGTVSVYEWPNLSTTRTIDTGLEVITHLSVSHNGSLLWAAGNGTALIHITSGNVLWSFKGTAAQQACDIRGDLLVMAGSQIFELWNITSGQRLWQYDTFGVAWTGNAALSRTGEYCALSIMGGSVWESYIMKTSTRKIVRWFIGPYQGSRNDFIGIAWHPTMDVMAAITSDRYLLFYDAETDKILSKEQVTNIGPCICWHPDGDTLAYGLGDDLVLVDYPAMSHRGVLKDANPWSAEFSPNGAFLAYYTMGRLPVFNPRTVVVNATTLENVTSFGKDIREYTDLEWSEDSQLLALHGGSYTDIWSFDEQEFVFTYPFSPGGSFRRGGMEFLAVGQVTVRLMMPFVMGELLAPSFSNEDLQVALEVAELRSNTPVLVAWDFGDGSTGVGVRTAHIWSDPGTYNVTATVVNEVGFSFVLRHDIYILDITPPMAVITGPSEVDEDRPGLFSASGSSDNDGIFRCLWTFEGDGSFQNIEVMHTFNEPGTFLVILQVWDNSALSNITTLTVNVLDVTSPEAVLDCPDWIAAGTLLVASAASSVDNVGIVSFDWDIEGVGRREGATVSVVITSQGMHKVSVNVSDAAGNWALAVKEVAVGDIFPPVLVFKLEGTMREDSPISIDASGSFDDSGGPIAYRWSLPDGAVETMSAVSLTLAEPGHYTVVLRVVDPQGNANETEIGLDIVDITPPTAVITTAGQTVDEDLEVWFGGADSRDNVGVVGWHWSITALGVVADSVNLTCTFAEPGTYAVRLEVRDGAGLKGLAEVEVVVADVTAPTLVLDRMGPLFLNASASGTAKASFRVIESRDNVGVVRIEWDLDGDGSIEGTGGSIELTIGPGHHILNVTAYDATGNRAARTVVITVAEPRDGLPGWILLGGIVVTIVLLVISIRMRRRPGPEA